MGSGSSNRAGSLLNVLKKHGHSTRVLPMRTPRHARRLKVGSRYGAATAALYQSIANASTKSGPAGWQASAIARCASCHAGTCIDGRILMHRMGFGRKAGAPPAYIAFFLSGMAGLIAEICWIRRAALAF